MRLWALKIKAHVTVTPELDIATMVAIMEFQVLGKKHMISTG